MTQVSECVSKAVLPHSAGAASWDKGRLASSQSLPPGQGKWSPRRSCQRKSLVLRGSIGLACCEWTRPENCQGGGLVEFIVEFRGGRLEAREKPKKNGEKRKGGDCGAICSLSPNHLPWLRRWPLKLEVTKQREAAGKMLSENNLSGSGFTSSRVFKPSGYTVMRNYN